MPPPVSANVLLVSSAVVLMAAGPFATQLTQTSDGTYTYLPVVATLASETLKLALSLLFYTGCVPADRRTHRVLGGHDIVAYAFPATVFALNNLLLFFVVQHIRPSLFQLLSSIKTLFTAVLFRILLHRRLSSGHVLALVSLAAGAAVAQLPTHGASAECNSGEAEALEGRRNEAWGVLLTLVSCMASSLGGVVNEKLLKQQGVAHSLWLANSLLYAWGVLVNGLALSVQLASSVALPERPATGGGLAMVLLVTLMAATGLLISLILKRLDNLVRVLAHTGAILLSMLLESVVTARPPAATLCLAVVIVGAATLTYAREPAPVSMRADAQLLGVELTERACKRVTWIDTNTNSNFTPKQNGQSSTACPIATPPEAL